MTRARFMWNNFADLTTTTLTASSEASGYPATNIRNTIRSKYWRTNGNFTIDATNNKIYINDGVNKTVTLTSANYSGGAAMATHIQTQLNAASSAWTVAYSTSTYKFTFSHATATLRFSQSTAAAWDTLGFIGSIDDATGPWVSDELRVHTHEYLVFDFGSAIDISFIGLVGKSNAVFTPSTSAVITLSFNSLDSWASPAVTEILTRTDDGIFKFIDTVSYRYARFKVVDRTNPNGPNLDFSYFYLGDYTTFSNTNVSRGFSKKVVDPSVVSYSDSGVAYFREKSKYTALLGLSATFASVTERRDFESMWRQIGLTYPVFVSIDPAEEISDDIEDLTGMFFFESEPDFAHNFYRYFDISFSFREAL